MMRSALTTFIKYPILGNALIAFLLFAFFGWYMGFWGLKTAFFPERSSKRISIQVGYYGASPEEMEEGITVKIEDALKGVVGIDEIRSTSSENLTSITVIKDYDTDIDELMTDVKNAVDRINSFPENAEKPVIYKRKAMDMVAYLNLSGKIDLMELKKQAEIIEDDLLASDTMSQVTVSGHPDIELSVEINESQLSRYQLSIDDISNAIRINNMDMSGGAIKSENEELLIRSRQRSLGEEDIENIVVRSLDNGSDIRVKDIAVVEKKFAETPYRSYFNGNPSISIQVQKLPEEDLESISNFLQRYVKAFNNKYDDREITILFDFNYMLQERISTLTQNGLQGLVLVLVLLGLFLNVRLSIWVAWGIPASFIGMFIIASFLGVTINMISLFGMILVVGILVDDGIVIAENIYKHYENGAEKYKAAIDGTMEVFPAVFTSVTTTMIAFIPLLLSEGSEFIGEMAIVVVASLGFSLIEAFVVLPMHIAKNDILKPRNVNEEIRKPVAQRLFEKLRILIYDGSLNNILRNRLSRYASLFVGFVAFPIIIIILIATGVIKTTFFPSIPFEEFSVDLAFKPGEREMKTEKLLWQFNENIHQVNQDIINETGDTLMKYTTVNVGVTKHLGQNGGHAGHVYVSVDAEGKSVDVYEFIKRVREKIGTVPEAEQLIIGKFNRWGKPVSLGLLGKDINELRAAKEKIIKELRDMDELRDISDNSATGKREIDIKLKPQAYALGFTNSDIIRQIRQGFFGDEIQRIQEGNDEVKIWVRYSSEDRSSIHKLEQMKIRGRNGEEIPLESLVEKKLERGIETISHYNGSREVRIEAEKKDHYASTTDILEKVRNRVEPILSSEYSGVQLTYGGERRQGVKTMRSLQKYGFPAICLMFGLIMVHFRSFSQGIIFLPLIIMGFCCASIGHIIRDIPLSVLSAYGILALFGVIVNDAVVMIDKFNRLLRNGTSLKSSAYMAGISRFRAITLTSITTVAGLMPLMIQNDFQSRFLIPMAVSVAFGVLFGTFFILYFVPPLMMALNDLRQLGFWLKNRKWPENAEMMEPAVKRKLRLEQIQKETSDE